MRHARSISLSTTCWNVYRNGDAMTFKKDDRVYTDNAPENPSGRRVYGKVRWIRNASDSNAVFVNLKTDNGDTIELPEDLVKLLPKEQCPKCKNRYLWTNMTATIGVDGGLYSWKVCECGWQSERMKSG